MAFWNPPAFRLDDMTFRLDVALDVRPTIGIPRTIPPYGDRLSGVFGGGICLTPLGVMITPKI